MIFRNYLENILGSKVKIKILRALYKFPDKGFSVRQLASFLDIDHKSVALSVKEFEAMNLVRIKTYGKTNTITLNKKSYIYKNILGIFKEEKRTFDELIRKLKSNFKNKDILSCAVFGSLVKGQETPSSDIDLLIVTRFKEKIKKLVAAKQDEIIHLFGNALSPTMLTRSEFKRTNPALRENILNNHILIYGRKIEEI